jgi:hypothetical protein
VVDATAAGGLVVPGAKAYRHASGGTEKWLAEPSESMIPVQISEDAQDDLNEGFHFYSKMFVRSEAMVFGEV